MRASATECKLHTHFLVTDLTQLNSSLFCIFPVSNWLIEHVNSDNREWMSVFHCKGGDVRKWLIREIVPFSLIPYSKGHYILSSITMQIKCLRTLSHNLQNTQIRTRLEFQKQLEGFFLFLLLLFTYIFTKNSL